MRDAAHCAWPGCDRTRIVNKRLWLCARCYRRHRARLNGPRLDYRQSFRAATAQERAELDALRAELLAAWAPDAPDPARARGTGQITNRMRKILSAMAK